MDLQTLFQQIRLLDEQDLAALEAFLHEEQQTRQAMTTPQSKLMGAFAHLEGFWMSDDFDEPLSLMG